MCRFRSPFNLNRFPHVSQAKRLASSPWWVNVSVKVEEMKRSREEEEGEGKGRGEGGGEKGGGEESTGKERKRGGEKERKKNERIRLSKSAFRLNSLPHVSTSQRYASDLHIFSISGIFYHCQEKMGERDGGGYREGRISSSILLFLANLLGTSSSLSQASSSSRRGLSSSITRDTGVLGS